MCAAASSAFLHNGAGMMLALLLFVQYFRHFREMADELGNVCALLKQKA